MQNRTGSAGNADLDRDRRLALLETDFPAGRTNVALPRSHAIRILTVARHHYIIFRIFIWLSLQFRVSR